MYHPNVVLNYLRRIFQLPRGPLGTLRFIEAPHFSVFSDIQIKGPFKYPASDLQRVLNVAELSKRLHGHRGSRDRDNSLAGFQDPGPIFGSFLAPPSTSLRPRARAGNALSKVAPGIVTKYPEPLEKIRMDRVKSLPRSWWSFELVGFGTQPRLTPLNSRAWHSER
ncbi:hypothetical protein KM043_011630 [Ampulex compressa]|nr:hypothetical protein KM043_011630 [Ampulex compressa]